MRQKASLRTIGKHCANSILQADAKAAKPNLFVLLKKKNSSMYECLDYLQSSGNSAQGSLAKAWSSRNVSGWRLPISRMNGSDVCGITSSQVLNDLCTSSDVWTLTTEPIWTICIKDYKGRGSCERICVILDVAASYKHFLEWSFGLRGVCTPLVIHSVACKYSKKIKWYRLHAFYQLLSYDAAAVQDFFGRVTDFKTCKINQNHANLQLNACCVSSWQNRCDGGSPFTSPKDRNVKRQLRIAERSGWITSEAAKLNAQHAQQIFMLQTASSHLIIKYYKLCSPQGLLSEGNQQKYEQKAKNTCTFCPQF